MTARAITLEDMAREYGRTVDWMSRHWRDLVRRKRLPPPLTEQGSPVWDPAQVYAVRDRHLTAAERVAAAAFRAALDAAHQARRDPLDQDQVADDRAALAQRFGGANA